MTVDQARDRFPVGSQVRYFPDHREPHHTVCTVVGGPCALGAGRIVLFVTGVSHAVAIGHLEPMEAVAA